MITAILNGGKSVYKSIKTCEAYITGSSTICNQNINNLYEIHDNSASADLWTIEPSNSPIYVYYGSSTWAYVQASSLFGNYAELYAWNNGEIIASLPIQTCNKGDIYIYGNPSFCEYGIYYVTSSMSNSGYWYVDNGLISIYSTGDGNVTVYSSTPGSMGTLYAIDPNNYILSFEIANNCRGGGEGSSHIHVYPNPVSDILTIEIDAESFAQSSAFEQALTDGKPLKIGTVFDLRLYDGQSNLLRNAKTKGGTVEFNVSNLPDGIYYLHVYDGVNSTPIMQQIMVEH